MYGVKVIVITFSIDFWLTPMNTYSINFTCRIQFYAPMVPSPFKTFKLIQHKSELSKMFKQKQNIKTIHRQSIGHQFDKIIKYLHEHAMYSYTLYT